VAEQAKMVEGEGTMASLTDSEKRRAAARFVELKKAIADDAPDVQAKYEAFRSEYQGSSRAYVDSFPQALDRRVWVGQLDLYLSEEIEPQFWNPDALASAT
jgi:hypothetical protein